jgi:hypothetical protein
VGRFCFTTKDGLYNPQESGSFPGDDENHIKNQGFHNPDLEFKEFLRELVEIKAKDTHIILDTTLAKIINNQKN